LLSTLESKKKVDPKLPKYSALILVDVQNDVCADGGAIASEGRDLTFGQADDPTARAAGLLQVTRERAKEG